MFQKVKDFVLKNKTYVMVGVGLIIAVIIYKKSK